MENGGEITGVQHDNKITGVYSKNKSTESGSTGETNKVDEMALIEEDIAEAEQDIVEGTDLLTVTETETEDAPNKNVIHPYL